MRVTTCLTALLCATLLSQSAPGLIPPAKGAGAAPVAAAQSSSDNVPTSAWVDTHVKPIAVMLCIHGLSLHGSSYADFGKRMASLGVPTYAIDVRGFGSWQNTSGRVNFKQALGDIHTSLETLRRAHPDLPLVLVGESMGGALALQAAALNQDLVSGLICSVPAFKRSGTKLTEAKAAVGMLTMPNKQLNAGPAVVRRATKNPELASIWQDDPLARMHLSSKELVTFALFTGKNNARAQQIQKMPVLFLQGGKDQLIKPVGTYKLFNKIASADKQLVMLGDSEHLILEHKQFDNHVIDIITNWLHQHVARPAAQEAAIPQDVMQKAEGHLKIAEGFLQLNEPQQAEEHLLKVVDLAKGSYAAQRAESLLCSLPQKLIEPEEGAQTAVSEKQLRLLTHDEALANDRPTVIFFCAQWIESCPLVGDAIKRLGAAYAEQVNFVSLDADDDKNAEIIKHYAIKPLPAVLYLNGKNEVVGYNFGYPGDEVLAERIKDLVSGRMTLPNNGQH